MSWCCLQTVFFFVWLGSRTDSILSEGHKVKKPRVASCFTLSVWWQEWTKKGEEKQNKTHSAGGYWSACKRRFIFLAMCASSGRGELCLFWSAQADSLIQNIQQCRMEGKVTTVLSSLFLQMNLWSAWHVVFHFEKQTWNNLAAV